MKRCTIGLVPTLALGILVVLGGAEVQPAAKVPRIGFLSLASPAAAPQVLETFHQGLRELGWVEGQNIVVEKRWAEGKFDRLPALAEQCQGCVRRHLAFPYAFTDLSSRKMWGGSWGRTRRGTVRAGNAPVR